MEDAVIPEELRVVKALIVGPDGRYLMQLRDDIPRIAYPGHWSLFGGAVELGESDESGIRRELEEELRFQPLVIKPVMRFEYTIPQHGIRVRRIAAFEVLIDANTFASLELREGADMGFHTVDKLSSQPNVVPWDLCMVQMHARVLPFPHLLATSPQD